MNNEETAHPSDDLSDDEYSKIEDHETQYKQTNWNNSFYTFVDNELQSSPLIEDPNKTYDWETTNNHENELVMTYDTNAGRNILYPRTFYALYIGPNDNSIGHLMINLIMTVVQLKMIVSTIPVMKVKLEVTMWIILKMRVTLN